MALLLSSCMREKLSGKHRVDEEEIVQCFANCSGGYLEDQREEHLTDPPTRWFIAETDYGRLLKIVFIQKDADTLIKTAYEPSPSELGIYRRFS